MIAQKILLNIFAIHAPNLIGCGYSVLPRIIKDGHGRPAVKSWSDWCEKQPGKPQLELGRASQAQTYRWHADSAASLPSMLTMTSPKSLPP